VVSVVQFGGKNSDMSLKLAGAEKAALLEGAVDDVLAFKVVLELGDLGPTLEVGSISWCL
jgi:hypothetical protein